MEISSKPIFVGNTRQLFLDDLLLAKKTGIRLVMNPPNQSSEAILKADLPWQKGHGIGPYHTVLQEKGRFRLWYQDMDRTLGGLPQEGACRLCYAESSDGTHWEKPELGLVEYRGSTANNIVAPFNGRQSLQGGTVFRDDQAPPESRYRLWTKFRPSDQEISSGIRSGLWAMHSPDGIRWQYDPGQPNPPRQICDTQNIVFWDRRIGQYTGYTRVRETQQKGEAAESDRKYYRSVGRITSPDFRNWSPTEIVFEADRDDLERPLPPGFSGGHPQVDVYTSGVFQHPEVSGAYFMMPSLFYRWGEDDFPGWLDVQLLTSRDGVRWNRTGERQPFLKRGMDGTPSGGMIFANPWPVFTEKETWIYYGGCSFRHGAKPGSQPRESGLFRAVMRRDGFLSVDAGPAGGELVTPPMLINGERLELNVDCGAGGWLCAELQDAEGNPLPGYHLRDCQPVVANDVTVPVLWQGTGMRSLPVNGPVRMRIVMRSAKLYSFRFG